MAESTLGSVADLSPDNRSLDDLTDYVYDAVQLNSEVASMFGSVPGDQRRHVADFLSEVFRGPEDFGRTSSAHSHVLTRHIGRYFTLQQRRSWMDLVLHAANVLGLPDDRRITMAIVQYLEWGSRVGTPRPYPRATVC